MYYVPKYFRPEEFFSKNYYHFRSQDGNRVWRLIDGRILWTADQLRMHFCGTEKYGASDSMTVNDWVWGGELNYRGYRDVGVDIIRDGNYFSITSQHCFGRGLDYTFGKTTAEEVRADILNNPDIERYKYISAIELKVSWNHNDVRCWDKVSHGIMTFNQ